MKMKEIVRFLLWNAQRDYTAPTRCYTAVVVARWITSPASHS